MTDQPTTPPPGEPNVDICSDHDLARCEVEQLVPVTAVPPGCPPMSVHTMCHLMHCTAVLTGCLRAGESADDVLGIAAELGRWQAQHLRESAGSELAEHADLLGAAMAVMSLHQLTAERKCLADGEAYPCRTLTIMGSVDPDIGGHIRQHLTVPPARTARWSWGGGGGE